MRRLSLSYTAITEPNIVNLSGSIYYIRYPTVLLHETLMEKFLTWNSHVHEHTSMTRHPLFRQLGNNNWSSLSWYPQILYHEVSWHNVISQSEAWKSQWKSDQWPVKSASIHRCGGSKVFKSFNLVLISRIMNMNCLCLKIHSGGFLS